MGALIDPLDDRALIAEDVDGRLVGVLTWRVDGDRCEVTTLYVVEQWRGIGTLLLDAVERAAGASGCRRLWLITMNDNLDALRL
jgi:GNAT superfamily N-acetyltransferase